MCVYVCVCACMLVRIRMMILFCYTSCLCLCSSFFISSISSNLSCMSSCSGFKVAHHHRSHIRWYTVFGTLPAQSQSPCVHTVGENYETNKLCTPKPPVTPMHKHTENGSMCPVYPLFPPFPTARRSLAGSAER